MVPTLLHSHSPSHSSSPLALSSAGTSVDWQLAPICTAGARMGSILPVNGSYDVFMTMAVWALFRASGV